MRLCRIALHVVLALELALALSVIGMLVAGMLSP